MFIGRKYELETLNRLYNEDKFHFIVMYGRRRVGKTTLLTEFCKDKPSIFFVAEEYNDKIALESFSDKILSYFGLGGLV
ncbi:MAG TPA: ATP-binding protein, partial [Thermoanaerobacter sp.]|nr:ATP-binding protein [Thermoanaerobacter sp.]